MKTTIACFKLVSMAFGVGYSINLKLILGLANSLYTFFWVKTPHPVPFKLFFSLHVFYQHHVKTPQLNGLLLFTQFLLLFLRLLNYVKSIILYV
jgi:hypothetical protein